jgi:hypothetical protein
LHREAQQIESMLNQSRSLRQLNDMIKSPPSELWQQTKLLSSLVAEAQTGDLDHTKRRSSIENADDVIKKAIDMLNVCTQMENSVRELDEAILSGNFLEESIKRVQELSKKYGTYCVVSLNNARELLKGNGCGSSSSSSSSNSSNSVGIGSKSNSQRFLSCRELDPSDNTSRRIRIRQREKEMSEKHSDLDLQMEKTIDVIEKLKQTIIETKNGSTNEAMSNKERIINALADVVQIVENYSNMQ